MVPLFELERAYLEAKSDASFQAQFENLLKNFAGRPTPLQFASRLTEKLGGPRIYLKREDLLHTGAHKINNALGQGLLAVKMGKPRIVAETGAGQHGVASATVAAHLGLECVVYMGTEDMARQALNVARMRMLGAEVMPVDSGSRTLKDAINEAMRDWVTNVRTTHYLLGSVLGAHPYPTMVRDFQTVIGREAREQILAAEKRLPTHLFACVGGGSNSIGLFHQFLRDPVPTPTFCKMKTGKSRPRIPFPRGSIIPPSARSTPGSRTSAAPNTLPPLIKPLSMPRACSRAPKGSFRRLNPRMPLPACSNAYQKWPGPTWPSSTSPAAATRTWTSIRATSKSACRMRQRCGVGVLFSDPRFHENRPF